MCDDGSFVKVNVKCKRQNISKKSILQNVQRVIYKMFIQNEIINEIINVSKRQYNG